MGIGAYIQTWTRILDFHGRASRAEYWNFYLFNILVAFFLALMASFVEVLYIVMAVYSLALSLCSLTVLIRRLHDINKSGFWMFITLIPIVGGIWLFILLITAGDFGPNNYGDSPYAF